MRPTSSLLACALALGACQPDEEAGPVDTPGDPFAGVDRPNVLLVILDDAGVDKVSSYGMHPDAPPTPHIDALAAEGQRFTQAWAYPMCSPTRAALLTGQHVRRYGIGSRLLPNEEPIELKAADTASLADLVADVGYDTSFVGKWHLSAGRLGEAGYDHPTAHGFAWSEGSLANLVASMGEPESDRGYTYWEELRNGRATWRTRYATSEVVDDAIDRALTMEEPWFLWVGLHSVHTPLHVPPPELYDGPLPATDVEYVDAMVQAMDAEIGRLLAGLPRELLDRTNVVLVGDNGTAEHGIAPPFDPAWDKGTVYEGGVRVPLVVRGPAVAQPGAVSDALVHVVDVFPTVAEWSGADPTGLDLDGTSWVPVLDAPDAPGSEQLFVEHFTPIGPGPYKVERSAARDGRFKYVLRETGQEELRRVGPDELPDGPDLLSSGAPLTAEEEEAWARLSAFVTSERDRLRP